MQETVHVTELIMRECEWRSDTESSDSDDAEGEAAGQEQRPPCAVAPPRRPAAVAAASLQRRSTLESLRSDLERATHEVSRRATWNSVGRRFTQTSAREHASQRSTGPRSALSMPDPSATPTNTGPAASGFQSLPIFGGVRPQRVQPLASNRVNSIFGGPSSVATVFEHNPGRGAAGRAGALPQRPGTVVQSGNKSAPDPRRQRPATISSYSTQSQSRMVQSARSMQQ
jgi:hypothetical protein